MQFEYEEALYRAGHLRGDELPAIALRMVEAGFDSPAACELASLHDPTLRDAGPLFERALAALGRLPMTRVRAFTLVQEALLRTVAAGEVDPFEGAHKLHLLWLDLQCPADLAIFVGLEDEASEHPEARTEIAREIRLHATRLLQRSLRAPSA